MKRVRIGTLAVIAAVVLVLALSVGCSTFDKTAYQSLSISKTTYDTAMKIAADLYSKEVISDKEKGEVIRLGRIYKGAHNTAVQSFLDFKKSGSQASELTYIETLSWAASALVDLLDYVYYLERRE